MPLQEPLDRNRRGREAEAHARRFLEARGLKTLATNYRTRWGEIDLVMEQAGTLVFVEVRTRVNNSFGGAAASVTRAKQLRLIRAASRFLEHHRLGHRPARFDIVAILGPANGREQQMEWLADAFRVTD